jgi:hypothetical protein
LILPLRMPSLLPRDLCHGRSSLPTGMYPKKKPGPQRRICTPVFCSVVPSSRIRPQPGCVSIDKCTKKMPDTHTHTHTQGYSDRVISFLSPSSGFPLGVGTTTSSRCSPRACAVLPCRPASLPVLSASRAPCPPWSPPRSLLLLHLLFPLLEHLCLPVCAFMCLQGTQISTRGPHPGAVHPWSSVLRAYPWQLKPDICTQRCHLWQVLL